MKDFKIAKMYYRMADYTASIQVLNNIVKDFPETPHKEEILFLVVKSYHKFAKESIFEKQKDRHTKAIVAYNEFVAQYPESKFIAEASDLKEKSRKELEAIYNKDQQTIQNQQKGNQEGCGIPLYKPTK